MKDIKAEESTKCENCSPWDVESSWDVESPWDVEVMKDSSSLGYQLVKVYINGKEVVEVVS